MINRVTAVVLFVEDFDKCLAFYRDQVGMQVVMLEPKAAAFKLNDQDFAMVQVSQAAEMVNAPISDPPTRTVNKVMLCTKVEDADKAYEELKGRGVEFTQPPTTQPWGIRAAYFKDPEGNIWEVAHDLKK
jgi:uncharacterized glyoxalase superfamily protein PhnB